MIRLFHTYFPTRTVLLAMSEAFLIVLALIVASFAWFRGDTLLALLYEQGFYKIGVVSGVCFLCMHYYDLYDSFLLTNPRQVPSRLIQVLGTACVLLAFLYYLYPVLRLGQGIFAVGIVFVGVALAGCRKLFFLLNESSLLVERAIVIGYGPLATALAAEIRTRPHLGISLVGYMGPEPDV